MLKLELSVAVGIASARIPSSFKTRFDSEKKSPIGLKCWADSNAITQSYEEFENGSILAVEFSFDMLPGSTEANCEKFTFTEEICNEGY